MDGGGYREGRVGRGGGRGQGGGEGELAFGLTGPRKQLCQLQTLITAPMATKCCRDNTVLISSEESSASAQQSGSHGHKTSVTG